MEKEYRRKAVLIPYCEIKVYLLKLGMTEQDYIDKMVQKGTLKETAIKNAQSIFRPTLNDDESDRKQCRQLKDGNYQIDFQEKLESFFNSPESYSVLESFKEENLLENNLK